MSYHKAKLLFKRNVQIFGKKPVKKNDREMLFFKLCKYDAAVFFRILK